MTTKKTEETKKTEVKTEAKKAAPLSGMATLRAKLDALYDASRRR